MSVANAMSRTIAKPPFELMASRSQHLSAAYDERLANHGDVVVGAWAGLEACRGSECSFIATDPVRTL